MGGRGRSRAGALGMAAALLGGACFDFHLEGPEDPEPISPPALVTVTIEYRQPAGCVNSAGRCDEPVIFAASWMRPGQQFALQQAAGFIWRGTATNVPVNFPPRDVPHAVQVFDPHILDQPSGGFTAERLRVGGETLTVLDSQGTPRESGLVYIDDNGQGHNP